MSFGHAAYLGIGGYAVGILAFEGIGSGFIQWPVAVQPPRCCAGDRCVVVAHPRRLFHHDQLAFAQMAYYVASGLSRYGGDDGLTIYNAAISVG